MARFSNKELMLMRFGMNVHKDDVVKEAIYRANASSLRVISIVALVLLSILSVVATVVPFLGVNLLGYVVAAAVSAVICILSWTTLKRDYCFSLHFVYIFAACLLALGIYNSVNSPNSLAVVFIALICIVPTLFSDRPWRMVAFSFIALILFCASSILVKPVEVWSMDVCHAIIFAIVGISVGTYITNTKATSAMLAEHIEYMSSRDALTGVFNRHAFEEELKTFTSLDDGSNVAIVSIDVNGLKATNDKYGHAIGDELIKGVAECLTKTLGTEGNIYRIGGDEFVSILHVDKFRMQALVDAFRAECRHWEGENISSITVSIGWAFVNDDPNLTPEELLSIADKRMYDDKSQYYTVDSHDRRVR